jgi:hypothetical protein
MTLNLNNFKGILNLEYIIDYNVEGNYIVLYLKTKQQDGSYLCIDCVVSEKDNYEDSLSDAFDKAQYKWNINLKKQS